MIKGNLFKQKSWSFENTNFTASGNIYVNFDLVFNTALFIDFSEPNFSIGINFFISVCVVQKFRMSVQNLETKHDAFSRVTDCRNSGNFPDRLNFS